MGEARRDESISPMTSPPPASPAPAAPGESATAAPVFVPPKRIDSLRNPAVSSAPALSTTIDPTAEEAGDYINGGLPHENLSPVENGPGKLRARPDWPSTDSVPKETNGDNNSPSADVASPAGRRSVQFARADVVLDAPAGHARNSSWDDPDGAGKSLGASFMSKLKALAVTGSLQTPKSPASVGPSGQGSQSMANSPTVNRLRRPSTLNEETNSDDDADAEETADESAIEGVGKQKKKKRRMRRFIKPDTESTPATPMARYTPGLDGDSATVSSAGPIIRRRASMPDEHQRHHMSEGEGREQLRDRPWRNGSAWMMAGANRGQEEPEEAESPAGRRMGHLRRITVFGGGGVSDGDAMSPRRPPIFSGERASTFGAQKWNKVKNTLKLLRQKKDERFDFAKSAELMAELRAGAPAVLMLASMIQRDEHGNKRIPVLLEQVKLRISDSSPMPDDDSERHWIFTMDLEYGSGASRMKWTVIRTLRDIYNMHLRYKFAIRNDKYLHLSSDSSSRPKQPKFPWGAFPYLRGARKKEGESDEEDLASVRGDDTAEGTAGEGTADGTASDLDLRQPLPRRRTRNLLGMRRKSTGLTDQGTGSVDGQGNAEAELIASRKRYVERQRRVLEKYVQEMIRWLMFRADSNRLCRFLELSALGVRLAAEGSYHGKECYLHIQSSKGLDFRRVLTPKKVIARHSRKWFLVRQSYIVCVESPENMNVYDVYLVDSKFRMVSKKSTLKRVAAKAKNEKTEEIDLTAEELPEKHHTLTLHTAERKVKLFSRYQSIMRQFEESVVEMLKQTPWHLKNRFDSFAPIRQHVFAQWLVDGRDYMWNVSRAINMAKDVIYIHDWWLSPELYMRRPAAISQKWRLDRLLQRKAQEGVKIFVIVYRNVEAAIPIDSEYTKYSLLNLHPNIFVQRSPNQFKKNQFFFAHHEKICIVDHDIAFVGGIDLCFGRWDCPQHPMTDDKSTGFEPTDQPKDAEHCQLFPGKDYSNPRVQDFFRLAEPYEEMYDRSKVPRMPWHDIAMQVVGQPARDLTRHFVQRWNYIRRGRKPTRPLPFLLPPPDARMMELEAMGLTGTCEVQILRSASTWSLGTTDTEQSIHHAYVKMIEDSEHFVYMENQFFITSTETFNTRMVNRIGDALVDRIIRAHENDEDWKCCIIIPLLPGFQNTVDEQEGSSVRLILQCQYRSICRGEHSIFGRLRAAGIEPEDYIQFFSLRTWAKIGPKDVLVTEQLYIHAKAIIVDDRIALIGSANINERSMLGNRDSEAAAIVRDTDMIWSTMGGRPYRVGRFAHTLRLRLMREHLGLDVDEILETERQVELDRQAEYEADMQQIYAEDDGNVSPGDDNVSSRRRQSRRSDHRPVLSQIPSFNHDVDLEDSQDFEEEPVSPGGKGKEVAGDARVTTTDHRREVEGFGKDNWKAAQQLGLDEGRDSVVVNGREVLVHDINPEGKGTLDRPVKAHRLSASADVLSSLHEDDGLSTTANLPPAPTLGRRSTSQMGLLRPSQLPTLPIADDTDIGGPPLHLDEHGRPRDGPLHPLAADIKLAYIDKDCMRDPLNPAFFDDVWNRVAENNTKIYRRVFRCHPDSEVHNWNEYNAYMSFSKTFRENMDGAKDEKAETTQNQHSNVAAAAGVGAPGPGAVARAMEEKVTEKLPFMKALGHQSQKDGKEKRKESSEAPDEKQGLSVRPEANRSNSKHSHLSIDVDKPLPAMPMNHAVSPVLPAGDTPFPAFETGELPHDTTASLPTKAATEPALKSSSLEVPQATEKKERRTTFTEQEKPRSAGNGAAPAGSVRRRRRTTTKSRRGPVEEPLLKAEAEELLDLVQGNLVAFPYDWLITEESNGNWLYQVDGVAPLQIYN